MGQIFGCGGIHDPEELRRTVARMGAVMRRPHQAAPVIWVDEASGVGLGCVPESHGPHQTSGSGQGQEVASLPCVLDGIFYRGPAAGTPRPEQVLLTRYGDDTHDVLAELDGSFAFALYLRDRRQLAVASDRFATRALYWIQTSGRFLFASELKAILAAPCMRPELDFTALAQCAAFNRILGQQTLARGVSRLQGGAVLEWQDGEPVRLRRYWRADDVVAQRHPLSPDRRDATVAAFREAVRLRALHSAPLGISLSGGLDSRAIAAALAADGIHAVSCTTGFAGSADQRLAAQVSQVARTEHHFLELKKEMVADYPQRLRSAAFIRDELLLVGGFPAGLHEKFCVAHEIRTLLRGHGAENMKLAEAWPFQVTTAVSGMQRSDELARLLRRVLSNSPADIDLDRLLPGAGTAGVSEALEEAVDQAIADHPTLTPAEIMSVLYLVQNDGLEVPLTRNGLRGRAEMALPFLDYRVLDLVLGTRVADRCGTGIHIAIMRQLAPRLLRIGNSNTGAPVDASRLRLVVTDKVNTLFKRLGVPGFRHYHYMEQWLQGFLADQVRAIVLDERTLGRGLFPREYLTVVMDRARHDSGLSRLVNFVMNVEIWCRLFLDGEAPPAAQAAQ